MGFFRPTFTEIDLGAVRENFKTASSLLDGKAVILAMVKADAYGHGAVHVSRTLEECGVAGLGVATVEEGLELRESSITLPIIVMGGLMGMGSPASGMMVGADLTPVVHSTEVIEFLEAVCRAAGKRIGIHLKVDTGMSRLGIMPSSLEKLLGSLAGCSYIKLEGVMTHFAEAEDEEFTALQMKRFKDLSEIIEKKFGEIKVWHCANSAALIDGENIFTKQKGKTWVRPGLMLYGAYPSEIYRERVSLRPVMSIKSSVVLMKTVDEGAYVSYNRTFKTARKTRLAAIPIGYADGYPWALSNRGEVLIRGRRAPVVGRVTMDMIMVDVTDTECRVGDKVILLGRQEGEEISVEELSEKAGTISYELFCGISKRMPRVYRDGR